MTETPRRRSRVFILLAIAVVILVGIALGAWVYFSGRESTDEAQANYSKASKDLDRLKPLVAKDEIPRQQYDAAVAAADGAKAAFDSAEAGILEAESAISAAEARVTQARGSFGEAEAEAQAAN